MKSHFLFLMMAVMTYMVSQAKTVFPDSETASNEVELGVEGIARLCPTALWDHWTFRDIVYDEAGQPHQNLALSRSWIK